MGCGFCESVLSNSVGTLVVDCVVKPAGRQLDYVRRFHDNVEKLRERKRELTMARDRLRHEIEDAERQLQRIEDDVRDLQSKVDKILTDVETLEEEIQQSKRCLSWCPNWSWRYRLSKKAMKKTLDISELSEKITKFCQPGRVGYRDESALPKIGFWCSEEFVGSKSANTAFNEIIEGLQDDSISLLGLWGMGGVGKTTLVRQVGNHAQNPNLFNKVVIATVSQRPNFEAIQDSIAQFLGFDMKNERGSRRSVQELWQRLKSEKRILIILDDVWTDINLKEKIGIPLGEDHKGCKILLTTRRQEVCVKMDCQKVVPLGCLDSQEAWTLFAKKAGLNDSSEDDINKLANQIIKKCQGLPIAIVTLGSALKGKNRHGWATAYRRLKKRKLPEIEGVKEKNAYLCLEASFDYLEGVETKICFLLCSLFPEDYEIYVEDLVRYAWGLELYKGIDSIEEVRSEVLAAMDILKNSWLLLDCGERHVKMHDTVREFALWLASSKKEMSFVIYSEAVETWPKDENFEHCTAISFNSGQIAEPRKGLVFPSLKILLLGEAYADPMATSNEFFEGMKALKVCALDGILISLAAFQFQTNLRTLHLKNSKISDISILGKLKTLQVLSFDSSDMTELPDGIGELENLKLLELSNCRNLRRVPPHSIVRLSNLEELYLDGCSSMKWATENATEKESYSSLSELNSLLKLAVLSLDISLEQLPKGFVFCTLQRFDVCIGIQRQRCYEKRDFETCPISRSLKIETAVEACKQLFEGVESLHLTKVKTFWIDNCKEMICATPVLKNLEELKVESCDEMQELFQIAELRSIQQRLGHLVRLQSLKVVEIDSCNKLRFLFPMSVANSLGQLETLKINRCSELEEIIQATEVSEIQVQQGLKPHVSLQSLKFVEIIYCHNLKYLFPMSVANSLGQLGTLKIKSCLRLKEIIQATEVAEVQVQQGLNRHLSFQSLKVVEIYECNHLRYLFPTFVAHNLEQLENLMIKSCLGLEEIIQAKIVSDISLQSLKFVEIDSCNKLRYVFPMSVANSLGHLESLRIESCLRLEEMIQATTTSGVSLQNLKVVEIDSCNILRYLFPMSIANSLARLESLNIKNCFGLEEIIQARTVSDICLQSLNVVEIASCNKLKYVFPLSVASGLGHLESLKIKSCLGLEEIIQARTVSDICLQSLKVVEIDSCNKLKYVFGMSVASNLGHLESLKIKSCLGLEEIIQATTMSDVNLQSLRKVYVEECNNLTSLSSLAHGHRLKNLTTLGIYHCVQLEYTFPSSMAEGLPQLNVVHLVDLPQLKGRDGTDIALSLRSLQKLKVHGCNQLIPFTISAEIQEVEFGGMKERKQMCNMVVPELKGRSANMEYLTITNFEDLFDSGYNLSSMRKLRLKALPELRVIWKGPVQVVNFQNLTNLVVYDCRRLRYVFSPTIASNLPQLRSLWISDCEELEQIIEKDQTSSQYHDHRQPVCFPNLTKIFIFRCENLKCLFPITVACGGLPKLERLNVFEVSNLEQVFEEGDEANLTKDRQKMIQLPQLKNLSLKKLANLVSFSPVGYHFSFPSLHWLEVKDCPNAITSFGVDSKQSVHVKTEASQSVDEITVEESATAQKTTWAIGSDISWRRKPTTWFTFLRLLGEYDKEVNDLEDGIE